MPPPEQQQFSEECKKESAEAGPDVKDCLKAADNCELKADEEHFKIDQDTRMSALKLSTS